MDVIRMHKMIEKLSECAEHELNKGVENVDTNEMKEVIDMLKDLSEAMYYRTLTKTMEEAEPEETLEMFERYGDGGQRYYDEWRYKSGRFAPKGRGTRKGYEPVYNMTPEMYEKYPAEYYRDMDRQSGKMYYTDMSINPSMRDANEGRSGMSRKTYMETKQMHTNDTQDGKNIKAKKLDEFFGDLYEDMKEMAHDMSNEEKTVWKQRVAKLNQLVQ